MLVGALQVEADRDLAVPAALGHRRPGDARVPPDVEDVLLSPEVGAAAARAFLALREVGRGVEIPGLDALLLELVGNPAHERWRHERLAALLAVEDRDGHAPGALARQAPVGPVLDHVVDALAPPSRDPANPVDLVEGAAAQPVVVEREEPLVGGPEDHRPVAAPAVRVLSLIHI